MLAERFSWAGLLFRLLAALLLVYATYNPEGYSFFHWAVEPVFTPSEVAVGGSVALKFFAGIVLVIGWVVFLQATHRSLGVVGVLLSMAFCVALIWLMIDLQLFSAENLRTVTHLVLVVVSGILAVGMSWSHVSRRLSGQVDTDEVE
jgi:hypothetical protein